MDSLAILLLEDNFLTATDIKEALEKAGHRITAIVCSYPEAVASIQQQTPDLAIIDIHLAGSAADGITIAGELLKHYWMPLIYLTANSEQTMFQRAKQTDPAAYLLKPFRQNELAFQVELAYLNQFKERSLTSAFTASTLYLPVGKAHQQIRKEDVLYLQASGSYVNVFMLNEPKPYLLAMHLGHLAQYFVSPNFFRLSRSLLINLDHVSRVEADQVLLNHRVQLAISEGNRSSLLRQLTVVRSR
ncbi:response regulator [Fibrella forsythiae]|uniref:Response regulator n=1 Tax=Fibrella forsythiae TaxID=2817061 RepID=A0ABS3JSW9_9BACT|nr:response regulator [Fibrella forsythiae]MBO0953104.1 response regulator [Fibrella forsythiae]